MTNKVRNNIKFVLSIFGTIFGHPAMIVVGAFLTLGLQEYLNLKFGLDLKITEASTSVILFPLMLILVTFVRYCFFYFWNYERIKHLSFIDGFRFFVSLQLYQIVFIPLYIGIQLTNFHLGTGGMIVLAIYFLALLILSIFVFAYMIIKLYKYEKFDLPKER
ncbi:MAG: hypothetical protein RBR07_07670 [Arcobacteraceae bacterium]|nr:hypothetical protein [Arcobacteraceae bacterium]